MIRWAIDAIKSSIIDPEIIYALRLNPGDRSVHHQAIDTQHTGSSRRDIKEDEAEENRQLAVVLNRPAALGSVDDEVGKGHLTAGDERRDPSPQSDHDEQTGPELDEPGRSLQRSQVGDLPSSECAE